MRIMRLICGAGLCTLLRKGSGIERHNSPLAGSPSSRKWDGARINFNWGESPRTAKIRLDFPTFFVSSLKRNKVSQSPLNVACPKSKINFQQFSREKNMVGVECGPRDKSTAGKPVIDVFLGSA